MNTTAEALHVAVKCKQCNFTIFYKTSLATGMIECKCPRCKKIVSINLALRRSKRPLYFRRTTPLVRNISRNRISNRFH